MNTLWDNSGYPIDRERYEVPDQAHEQDEQDPSWCYVCDRPKADCSWRKWRDLLMTSQQAAEHKQCECTVCRAKKAKEARERNKNAGTS